MKRSSFYVLGNILISLGVALLIKAELGTGAWDAMFVGLSKSVGLTVGSWVFIIGTIVMIMNKFLSKEKLDITAFLTIFLGGFFIDLFLNYVVSHISFPFYFLRIPVFVSGILLMSFGISVYIQAKFATSPIDNLMISLNKRFGLSFRAARTIGEISALLFAFIFGGPIFIGTLFVAFSVGPLIQFFHKPVEKLYQKI